MVQVHDGRGIDHRWRQYDRDWAPLSRNAVPGAAPAGLEAMIDAAKRLAPGRKILRVGGQPLFGEFCLNPGSGLNPFDPLSLDKWLGAQWNAGRSQVKKRSRGLFRALSPMP